MRKNVHIKIAFTCDSCGKEKLITKKVNYKKMQEDFEGIFTEAGFTFMPPGWSYTEGKQYDLECHKCTRKWEKKNGLYDSRFK